MTRSMTKAIPEDMNALEKPEEDIPELEKDSEDKLEEESSLEITTNDDKIPFIGPVEPH